MLTRKYLLALALGLAALAISAPSREAAADEQSDRIERLIRQLGASKFADRERAQRELRAIGVPALGALRDAAKDDGERGRRARDLVAELQQKALIDQVLAPKKVRLQLRDAPVIDAVDELVRQSGYNIQIQGEVANLVKRKVTLDTGETSFWQAFDQLCDRAGLVEIPAQPQDANPLQNDPRVGPGRQPLRPAPVRPAMPRVPQPRKQPPGGLKAGPPALGQNLLPPERVVVVQGQFPPRGGKADDEQLRELQKLLEQQMQKMLDQMQKQLQQRDPAGRPGMQKLDQEMLQQLLKQLQQLRQFQQMPQMQIRPLPGLGGRFRGDPEPVEPEIRQINVTDGSPPKVPTAYVGALRLRLLPTDRARQDEANLALDVSVEPRVPGFGVGEGSRIGRAVDDRGQELTASVVNRVQAVRGVRGVMSVSEPVVQIRLGDKESKTIKELRGQLSGVALVKTDPLIVVNDIFNAVGKTFKGANGGSIEILGVEKKGDGEVQVQMRQEIPAFEQNGTRAASLPSLVDAKGESYQVVQVPSRGRRTNGRVITQELTMLFKANPGQGDPTRLVLNGVRTVTLQLPFAFENVPLPAAPAR
jgi:hypothetical protein